MLYFYFQASMKGFQAAKKTSSPPGEHFTARENTKFRIFFSIFLSHFCLPGLYSDASTPLLLSYLRKDGSELKIGIIVGVQNPLQSAQESLQQRSSPETSSRVRFRPKNLVKIFIGPESKSHWYFRLKKYGIPEQGVNKITKQALCGACSSRNFWVTTIESMWVECGQSFHAVQWTTFL